MAPKDDDDSSPLAVTPDDSSPLAVAPDDSSSLLAVAAPDDSDAPKLVPSSLLDSEASKIIGSTPSESMAIDFLPDSEVVPDLLPPDSEVVPDSLPPDSEVVADSLPPGAFFCPHCQLVHEDRQSWPGSCTLAFLAMCPVWSRAHGLHGIRHAIRLRQV
jgi:hypothetical protein